MKLFNIFDNLYVKMDKARDLSKLTRKVITDKRGHRRTVWVKTGKKEVDRKEKKVEKNNRKKLTPGNIYYNYRRSESELKEEVIFASNNPEDSRQYGDILRVMVPSVKTLDLNKNNESNNEIINHAIKFYDLDPNKEDEILIWEPGMDEDDDEETKTQEEIRDEAIDLINPDEIVGSAGGWDDVEFINYLYEETNFFDKHDGVITKNGAVFFESNKDNTADIIKMKEGENLSESEIIKKIENNKPMQKAGPVKHYKKIMIGGKMRYFYTKEQYQKFKESPHKPERKTNKGGLLSGVMSFFGFKDDKQAKEKVTEIYNANKNELGIDKSTFSDYLNEYLSNKDKWDKKFQGKERVVGRTKDGKKVVKKPAGEKKAPGKKGFSLSIMKKVAGVVSSAKQEPKDNFATMPEGEGKKSVTEQNNENLEKRFKKYSTKELQKMEDELDAKGADISTKDGENLQDINSEIYRRSQEKPSDKREIMSPEEKKDKKEPSEKSSQANYDKATQTIETFEDVNEKNLYETEEEFNDYLKEMEDDWKENLKEPKDSKWYKEAVEELKKIKDYKKSLKDLPKLKEKLMGPKMFKAIKLNGKYYRMDKGKKVPPGSISKDGKKKKSADGTWVPIGKDKPTGKPGEKPKPDGKPEDKKKKKEPVSDENSVKERVKTALKKMANILAEALSGKDVVQPTGSAVEQAGEDIKRKKKQVKPEDKPKEKPKADKPIPLKKARDLSKLTRKVITDKRGHRRTVWVRTGKKEVKKEKKKINQTETKEFKDWFGDSKVVDKNGNPLVVYHGTDRKLTVIEPGYDEPGAWFTSDQKNASNYAKGLDAKIYDVYLKAEKPLNVPFEWNGEEMVPEIKGLDEDEMEELGLDNNVSIVKYAKSNGYDSVNFPNGNFSESGETWVVFDSSQIKSATDNRGTFDPESGEMNKAIR